MATVNNGSAYAVRCPNIRAGTIITHEVHQTEIVAVQRVFYHQTWNFICEYICLVKHDETLDLSCRSVDDCDEYSIGSFRAVHLPAFSNHGLDRVLYWGHFASLCGESSLHEYVHFYNHVKVLGFLCISNVSLARQFSKLCPVQHPTLPTLRGHRQTRWHQPRTFLPICLYVRYCMVFFAWVHLQGSLVVQLGHLASA